jgi:Acid sphingomyelin phosphodiesterase C-terminal region
LTRSVGSYNESKPITFNSILAPTTTYQGKNPSFAVYEIDEETMLIVNITTYFFNITKANEENKPEWEVYHNILEAYEMPDASPRSFEGFAKRLLKDEATAIKMNMWNAKGGPDGPMNSCDQNCRRSTYCDLVSSYADTEVECNSIEAGSKNTWRQE